MFRTETEQDFLFFKTIVTAKYWQCVREQSSYLDNLMILSFEYRRNQAKINELEEQIEKEEDRHAKVNLEIDLDECRYGKW